MKQAEDSKTLELPGTRRRGRKPLGDRAMTAAERQLKRRIADSLLAASCGSSILEAVMKVGVAPGLDEAARQAITDDLMQAFDDLRQLARAGLGQEPDAVRRGSGQAGEAGRG